HLTIWTSTQGAFGIRDQASAILGIPPSRIQVVPMEIGGGFGGKIGTYLDPVAALLSKKAGAPVKMVMTRKEVFEGTGPTSESYMRCKIGAKKDGTMTAAEFYLVYGAGGFPGSPVGAGAMYGLAPYKLANVLIDAYDVVVNKPKVAAYRAPGTPQAAFAVETTVDELAEKLGIDPMELRLTNAVRQGDRQVNGIPFGSVGCVEVEEAIKSHPHYQTPLNGAHQGRGVAMGFWGNGGMQSSATINVNADGAISLITGSVDLGGTRVALAMQAAEVLGVAAEDVIPSVGDTNAVGWTGVTGGSRTAFSTGIAVITAAEQIKRTMMERAAVLWETQPDEIEFQDGVFVSRKNPEDRLTFKELAAKMMATGGPITASATSNPRQVGVTFAGIIVDVEVDPETGKVQILRATAFQDVGQAAHPSYVEGQMQGGTAQGIGWALNEEYFFTDDGAMANASFLDYRIPTSLDLPSIETVIIEVPNPGHPFGVRGVGEVSIVGPMAAVANAIHDAVGVRMTSLPMSPGAVLKALARQKAAGK
ncbi:MAG: molybdopterin cofactor-binding domain-containing protein, partial [Dehalococcoidia bacterium]